MVRVAALLILAATVALAGCRPTPRDPIEFVEREDAILIQVLTVEPEELHTEHALLVPEITLYGDGTLIFRSNEAGGAQLHQAQLSPESIRTLIEEIAGDGFFDYAYEQPTPERASPAPTTFVYVQTLRSANAVRVAGADTVLPDDVSHDYDEFRGIQDVLLRIQKAIDEAELAAESSSFTPMSLTLLVQPLGETNSAGSPALFPDVGLDLAAIAPNEDEPAERRVDGDAAVTLWEMFVAGATGSKPPTIGPVRQGNRDYMITIVPVLPYAENFPEFDLA